MGLGSVLFFANISLAQASLNYSQGTASWKSISNAQCYNIYYKESSAKKYQHALRCLPSNMTAYTIKGLKLRVSYKYNVAALDSSMTQFSWSGDHWLLNLRPQK